MIFYLTADNLPFSFLPEFSVFAEFSAVEFSVQQKRA